MGGTEILEPLKKIYSETSNNDYPRYIFLLTDGEVSNTEEVIDLIRSNTDSTKVYSVGIGSSCSKELIKGAAEAGQGKCEFVEDNETEFSREKVMALLIESMSTKYESFSRDNTFAKMSLIIPDPKKSSIIPRGKSKFFFCFFEEAAFNDGCLDLKFFYKSDSEDEIHNFKTKLKLADCMDDSNPLKTAVHKLAYSYLFSMDPSSETGYYSARGPLSKEQKIEKSIHNGVLLKKQHFYASSNLKTQKKQKLSQLKSNYSKV
jgi:von Willebrand factor type A domain